MITSPSFEFRQPGNRMVFRARALLAVSVLAALAVSSLSFAQVPTFNALDQTPVTVGSGFPENATVGDINGDGKLDAMIAVGATNTFRDALPLIRQDQP
jgi:hypothetical protein